MLQTADKINTAANRTEGRVRGWGFRQDSGLRRAVFARLGVGVLGQKKCTRSKAKWFISCELPWWYGGRGYPEQPTTAMSDNIQSGPDQLARWGDESDRFGFLQLDLNRSEERR